MAGLEAMATVEVVVRCADVVGVPLESITPECLHSRVLPLATLGYGRASVVDKTATVVHQLFLDYGHSQHALQTACREVRQCMSDMGTEYGIRNAMNMVGELFAEAPLTGSADSFLFPFAMQVPGVLHTVDLCLRTVSERQCWFPSWLDALKAVVQCVRPLRRREAIAHRIAQERWPEAPACTAALLTSGIRSFAKWRWTTLRDALADLSPLEWLLRSFFDRVPHAHAMLGTQDGVTARTATAAIGSASFWGYCTATFQVCTVLHCFTGSVKGCHCHAEELKMGRPVHCVWKGRCGPRFASMVADLVASLTALGDALRPFQFAAVDTDAVRRFASQLAGAIASKFHWANELPYAVWKALVCKCSRSNL